MTVKDRVHQLVESLDEADAHRALQYLTRLASKAPELRPSEPAEIDQDDDVDWIARGRPLTLDSPLWNIVGMADSGPDGPTDVSRNKHKYLADAYADLHEEE
jgi:hypothetical protein